MKRHLFVAALGISFLASNTTAYAQVRADTGSIAIGGSVTGSTVIIGRAAADGVVESLARPGGNATVFMSFEIGVSAKWLELLKEIAPGVKRAAVLRTLATAAGPGQFGAIQGVAQARL